MKEKIRQKQRNFTKFASFLTTLIVLSYLVVVGNGIEILYDDYENVVHYWKQRWYNEPIEYTNIDDGISPSNYSVDTYYNAGGMKGLYSMTLNFMDSVVDKIDPTDFFMIDSMHEIHIINEDVWTSLKKFSGFIALLVVILVLLLLFPIIGLFFSCCRCCGNCGANPKVGNKKDKGSKICQGIFLIVLICGLLFCMICAFGSSEQLNDGISDFTDNIAESVHDISMFFTNTEKQMKTLLQRNFNEFREGALQTMDEGKTSILEQIDLNKTDLKFATDFVGNVKGVSQQLSTLSVNAKEINDYIGQYNKAISDIKDTIEKTCIEDCRKNPAFESIEAELITFDKEIPTFDEEITKFNTFNPAQISDSIDQITKTMNSAMAEAGQKFDENMVTANDAFDKASETIDDQMKQVTKIIDDMNNQLTDSVYPVLNDTNGYIKDYLPYGHAVAAVLSCILLLITAVVILGIIWGTFANRPEKGGGCCTKAGGSKLLICGVGLMFGFGFLIALVALLFCIAGIIPQRIVCDALEDPSNSKILNFMNDAIDMSQFDVKINITGVINDCKNNKPIYKVFHLEEKFDLQNITDKFNINDTLSAVMEAIKEAIPTDNVIIDVNTRNAIEGLGKMTFNFNFDGSELNKLDLSKAKKDITTLGEETSIPEIISCVEKVQECESNILTPMKTTVKTIQENIKAVNEAMKLGKGSLKEAVQDLLDKIDAEQKVIVTKCDTVLEVAETFVNNIYTVLQGYVNRILDNTQENLGRCQPLYNAIEGVSITACDKILKPVNGFWFSLFLELLVFIPTIVVCVTLAALYQKTKIATTPLNIPQDMDKKRKKTKKDKSPPPNPYYDGYENNGYENDENLHFGDYRNPHEPSRYGDMSRMGYDRNEVSTRF